MEIICQKQELIGIEIVDTIDGVAQIGVIEDFMVDVIDDFDPVIKVKFSNKDELKLYSLSGASLGKSKCLNKEDDVKIYNFLKRYWKMIESLHYQMFVRNKNKIKNKKRFKKDNI